MTVADRQYALSGVSLEFGVALEGEQDGAHLVALGEDDLVEFALFELRTSRRAGSIWCRSFPSW